MGEDGILVDLQRINQVTVSDDKKVASVGPGARWGDVQETVGAYNVSVVGGRTPSVGVGGLVLGGTVQAPNSQNVLELLKAPGIVPGY